MPASFHSTLRRGCSARVGGGVRSAGDTVCGEWGIRFPVDHICSIPLNFSLEEELLHTTSALKTTGGHEVSGVGLTTTSQSASHTTLYKVCWPAGGCECLVKCQPHYTLQSLLASRRVRVSGEVPATLHFTKSAGQLEGSGGCECLVKCQPPYTLQSLLASRRVRVSGEVPATLHFTKSAGQLEGVSV
uniref:Uncharacterized protein n=1 Tax=Timema tahoe TaxID=61484 RepID=A0A7R9IHW1_9NEOP|nr:unnamed protein product [Timema tahoe]